MSRRRLVVLFAAVHGAFHKCTFPDRWGPVFIAGVHGRCPPRGRLRVSALLCHARLCSLSRPGRPTQTCEVVIDVANCYFEWFKPHDRMRQSTMSGAGYTGTAFLGSETGTIPKAGPCPLPVRLWGKKYTSPLAGGLPGSTARASAGPRDAGPGSRASTPRSAVPPLGSCSKGFLAAMLL